LGGIIYLGNPFEIKKEMEKLRSFTAGQIMSKRVYTVDPGADVTRVATVMVEKDINGLPVVEDGKIIGIVTRHDLLSALAKGEFSSDEQMCIQEKPELEENIDNKDTAEKSSSELEVVSEIPIDYKLPTKEEIESSDVELTEISEEYQLANMEVIELAEFSEEYSEQNIELQNSDNSSGKDNSQNHE
jgi:hypothetical protein